MINYLKIYFVICMRFTLIYNFCKWKHSINSIVYTTVKILLTKSLYYFEMFNKKLVCAIIIIIVICEIM